MSNKQDDDRFGIPVGRIHEVIRSPAGIIRAGCYIPTRHEVATRDPAWLWSVLIDWLWESPTELIPTDEQIADVIAILLGPPDAETEAIQKIIDEAPGRNPAGI
jgi:hypothetical protein